MDFTWKSGHKQMRFSLPDQNIKAILERQQFPQQNDIPSNVEDALKDPVGSLALGRLISVKKAKSVLIVVNDITRPTPYDVMLPPLLKEIKGAGIEDDQITFLIANGIHRSHTDEENRSVYGEDVCCRYRIVNHSSDGDLMSLGILPEGIDLQVNRLVKEHDLVVATGLIGLHYIAGYSGGRKSIIPGIAGRRTIEATHRLMADDRACIGNLCDNPVNELLLKGARRAGVDFILNVITDDNKQIAAAVAGDLEEAWLKGVEYCRQASICRLDGPADIVIAGCGGYPKDINLYQAQKALEPATQAVRDGGVIILVAGCQEGMGEEIFLRWVTEAHDPEDIRQRFKIHFELGGHKAYAICRTIEKCQVVMVTDLDRDLVEKAFMIYRPTVEEAMEYAFSQVGNNPDIVVIPEAPNLAVELIR
ncbi:MAG: nickel-dependent lactate racemase [Syntrophomonadaceae bacterium]|nr:nickel-dependent lactate racemase [Syntrophomonadaceae bacterium]